MRCPCCGSEIDSVPVEALTEVMGSMQQKMILEELVRQYPRYVSMTRLIQLLWGHDPEGGPITANNVVSAQTSRLRRVIAEYGWGISDAKSGRGQTGQFRLERLRSST